LEMRTKLVPHALEEALAKHRRRADQQVWKCFLVPI
jgi:hypothetical protein